MAKLKMNENIQLMEDHLVEITKACNTKIKYASLETESENDTVNYFKFIAIW